MNSLWIVPLSLFLLLWLVGLALYPKVFHRPKAPQTPWESEKPAAWAYALSLAPQSVRCVSFDGLTLRGFFFHAPLGSQNSDKLAILVHGYHADGPDNFCDFIRFYHEELGWHVLLPDQRAHGRSDGKTTTFGALEQKDILRWMREYIQILGSDIQISLHGISMGGATVMLTGEQKKVSPQLKCIVNDCGYSDAFLELAHMSRVRAHFPCRPVALSLVFWCRVFTGHSLLKEAAPLKNMNKLRAPLLSIHGQEDEIVPFSMAKKLYETCTSPKAFLSVPDCGHNEAWNRAGELYRQTLRDWYGQWMTTTTLTREETH